MGHIEDVSRPNLHTIHDYLNYGRSYTANYQLKGVPLGQVGALARKYTAIHADGIMTDGNGQVANIINHARVHHIAPQAALRGICREIISLGDNATIYQLQTLENINDAMSLLFTKN